MPGVSIYRTPALLAGSRILDQSHSREIVQGTGNMERQRKTDTYLSLHPARAIAQNLSPLPLLHAVQSRPLAVSQVAARFPRSRKRRGKRITNTE